MASVARSGAFLPYPQPAFPLEPNGPFAGVTLAVKDVLDVAGFPTGAGSAFLGAASGVKTNTAPVVARLMALGARLVGKTVTDELAYSRALRAGSRCYRRYARSGAQGPPPDSPRYRGFARPGCLGAHANDSRRVTAAIRERCRTSPFPIPKHRQSMLGKPRRLPAARHSRRRWPRTAFVLVAAREARKRPGTLSIASSLKQEKGEVQ